MTTPERSTALVPERVGLVTVTYNSSAVLPEFLDSVAGLAHPAFHLFVVDNASADDTLAQLDRAAAMPLTVLRNEGNAGVAAANNRGIRAALEGGCDWVLLVNNDTVFQPSLLDDLLQAAGVAGASLVAPTILATEPEGSIWYGGARVHDWRGMQVKHDNMGRPAELLPSRLATTPYASTCCLLVHRRVFEAVGLMSEEYFVYGDDVDFALRLRRAGFEFWVAPSAVLLHKASALTGGFLSDFTLRWHTRNWVLVARRFATGPQLVAGLLYIQVWAIARAALRREPWRAWIKRQRAILEGLRAPLPTTPALR